MVEIAASILGVKEENIIQTIYNLETAGADYFHIDVMDGEFVENNNIEQMRKYTEYIKQIANTKLDVHLMVKDVENFVKAYIDMEVDSISFQIEACKNEEQILKLISYIKENNIKVGLAINPKTEIEKIHQFLPYIHKVIVMTVEAGKGGQELIPETLQKVKELKKFASDNNYDVDIEVDGGINDKTSLRAVEAGANILVSGSYIINSTNYKEAIEKLKF